MDTLQPFRDARQRLRDRAARYARMARASELAHNRSTEPHIKKMHLSDSVRFYASYRAFSVASSSIFHALRDAEKEMRKHDAVARLRAHNNLGFEGGMPAYGTAKYVGSRESKA